METENEEFPPTEPETDDEDERSFRCDEEAVGGSKLHKRGIVHNYFEKGELIEGRIKRKCKFCSALYIDKSSNLKKHLFSSHKSYYDEMIQKEEEENPKKISIVTIPADKSHMFEILDETDGRVKPTVITTGGRVSRNKLSGVWVHFDKTKNESRVICKHCVTKDTLQAKSSTLKRHLQRCHQVVFMAVEELKPTNSSKVDQKPIDTKTSNIKKPNVESLPSENLSEEFESLPKRIKTERNSDNETVWFYDDEDREMKKDEESPSLEVSYNEALSSIDKVIAFSKEQGDESDVERLKKIREKWMKRERLYSQ